jgi:cation diffusion facilitator family transporter
MELSEARSKRIKRASWAGILINGGLAAIKVIAGLLAGSLAVVGDGIDSTSDILSSIISLFTAIIISRPPDRNHPFGHFRAETISTLVLAFIIFLWEQSCFALQLHTLYDKKRLRFPCPLQSMQR